MSKEDLKSYPDSPIIAEKADTKVEKLPVQKDWTREDFIQKYKEIREGKIDLDDIEASIEGLLELAIEYDEKLREYANQNNLLQGSENAMVAAKNAAYELDVNTVDDAIIPVIEEILARINIRQDIEKTDKVLVEPDEVGGIKNEGKNTKGFEFAQTQDRLKTLEQILKLVGVDYKILVGNVRSDMIRQTPYCAVTVEEKDRLVLICDEVGNRTFVFKLEKLEELGLTTDQLILKGKEELKEIIQQNPLIGTHFIYNAKNFGSTLGKLIMGENEFNLKEAGKAKTANPEYKNLPRADKDGVYTAPDGNRYASLTYINKTFGIDPKTLAKYFSKHSSTDISFVHGTNIIKNPINLNLLEQDPDFVKMINMPRADENEVYTAPDGERYVSGNYFYKNFGLDYESIYKDFPEYVSPEIIFKVGSNIIKKPINLSLIEQDPKFQRLINLQRADQDGVYTAPDGNKYVSLSYIHRKFGVANDSLHNFFSQYIVTDIVFKNKNRIIDLSVNLIKILQDPKFQRLINLPRADQDGVYTAPDGQQYVSISYLKQKYGFAANTVKKNFSEYICETVEFKSGSHHVTTSINLTELIKSAEFQAMVRLVELKKRSVS